MEVKVISREDAKAEKDPQRLATWVRHPLVFFVTLRDKTYDDLFLVNAPLRGIKNIKEYREYIRHIPYIVALKKSRQILAGLLYKHNKVSLLVQC